ncbi:MAG: class I SAM-dependent methyltransferase [Proteobacteria bacterium]|nr:class I SAM-dependent methyltransferase [Pseudomonadota bacterium]MBU4471784.1 class I SAM-dependent methyltransferase [Pseudomonadota bacterium]MCG2750565.1 class I SAM-dependent methyltransferase [Desulfobacteraceae bacterium]
MADHVCPPWLGYVLLSPLRRFIENPQTMLGPLIQKGMTILEPGCAMGYFTLPMARMTGENGRVIAVDIQDRMLAALEKRANKAGLGDRIIRHKAQTDSMDISAHGGSVDLAVAIHVVHELKDPRTFFSEVREALKPGRKFLVVEPKGHVSSEAFDQTRSLAVVMGFTEDSLPVKIRGRSALFSRK